MEPIRSQGVVVPPDEYLPALKEICEETEVLLISDEAMVGFGRTGKLWGVDHWDVTPDIMYMAKSVANGMAIAPLVSTKEIIQYDVIRGGTYAGSLPACACAIAHIDVMQQEKLVERSNQLGAYLLKRLNELAETSLLVGDVRGRGLFIGIDLVKDRKSKEPATEEASRVVNELFQRGLLVGTSGVYSNVLRLMPPLIITKEEINTALTLIEDSIRAVEKTIK
jgi:4-aminobutyrate aminotransferase/(S)-3-amino-2-methylpropionate transaminase